MLCRALCAVAAVSCTLSREIERAPRLIHIQDVLCLLVLSGVQKDDLDAATLRKLQRHNVNIADNDGKLREQCLVKNKAATSSSTTEQVELKIDHDRSTSQPAAIVLNTAAELKKILNYFKEKETQREINIKEQTTQSNFILNGNFVDLSKLPSSVQSLVLKDIVDSRTETRINRIANKDNERLTLAHDDNDLQNIEKAQQERSSNNPNKKRTENPNDTEYISKIVAQILAQRQTTTSPPPTTDFDRSKLAQDIHSMLVKDLMKTIPQNLYLNNLNLTDVLNPTPVELKNNGEEQDIIVVLLNQLKNRNGLSNPYLPGMKKNTNLDDGQDGNRFETKSREGRGGNNILLNNHDNKPVIVDSNRNVPTVNGQFLSKWQNVNIDGDKKSLKAGIAGTNVRCIIFSHPNDPCNIQKDNEFYPNEANRSLQSFIIDGLRKGELKIQDVQKIFSMYWPTYYKVKPDIKNDLSSDNNFKTEWLLNSRSGEQFKFKEKYRLNSANDPLGNNEPHLEGKFHKNTWKNYYENPTMKQQYEFDRNKLLQVSNGKSEYNQRLTSNDEDLPLMNQFKNQVKLSDSVRPILNTNKDTDFGETYKSNKLYASGKEDIEKPKSIPPGMIKEIADSVKELVLRDLKKELSTSAATVLTTTESTTTPSTTTTRTTTTSMTTPATTQTTTTVEQTTTKTQTISTTTEKLSTTVKVDHLNIQEASKALEKFMEVFEKFKSIKDSIITPENITHNDKANNNNVIIKEVNRELRLSYPKPYDIRSQMKRPKPQILDPYSDPTTPDPVKSRSSKKPPGFALTLQTNSDEIHPLNVAVSRPLSIYNTIVVTPLPARQRSRNLHQSRYSAVARYKKPERYQIEKTENQSGLSPSKGSYGDTSNFKYVSRAKPRSKKERNFKDRGYKSRGLHGVEKFHEKLERADNWQRYGPGEKCSGSKENCNEPVAPRKQRPLINTGHSYDDTHFRNFLKTQQKVTDMLEKILATNTKHIPRSAEVI